MFSPMSPITSSFSTSDSETQKLIHHEFKKMDKKMTYKDCFGHQEGSFGDQVDD
jgi:hypothetical protein